MGWGPPLTWPQYLCSTAWQQVKAGADLDLDMDGYVPKEKQKEWAKILAEIPYTRIGAK